MFPISCFHPELPSVTPASEQASLLCISHCNPTSTAGKPQHLLSEGREHTGATKHPGSSYILHISLFYNDDNRSSFHFTNVEFRRTDSVFNEHKAHAIFSSHGEVTPRLCNYTIVITRTEFVETGRNKLLTTAQKSTQAAKCTQEIGQVLR